jgi:L-alanine-DL-glutamate epimerase-like enolase superfamily enzyme
VSAPRLEVLEVTRRERAFRLRMPFRFGVTTATHGRQAMVAVRIRLQDGREATGYAAEALGAKWFDKDLSLSDDDNHHQLRKSLELAGEAYRAAGPATAFDLFAETYRAQIEACGRLALNPLIASYGPALLDRAVLDALCRATGVSFYDAIRRNLPGIRPHAIAADLDGFDFASFLAGLAPQKTIHVRHTVGLADPITASDQAQRVGDGLPETLEEVVAAYGNRYFKLKVGGDREADLDRLERIAAVLDRSAEPYAVTLDGNEQYGSAEEAAALLHTIRERPKLKRLAGAMLYLEQPIKRAEALSTPLDDLAAIVPVVIDESDGELSSFPRARALGYAGVSSKSCKGFYKSILNLARCRLWNAEDRGRYFMSAEDLTCEPGLALQQDTALVSLLGLTHVERNAHHFIDGFGGRPEREARAWQAAHSDLYSQAGGQVRVRIENGMLAIGSLDCPGFATTVEPDLAATEPMPEAQWSAKGRDAA